MGTLRIDWFADTATIKRVLRGAFERPLSPAELSELWPTGPTIGGASIGR